MKYRLSTFEENRYHDSYGYIVFYNAETNTVERKMHWTTAGAGEADTSDLLMPTLGAVEASIKIYGRHIQRQYVRKLILNHYSPDSDKHLKSKDVVVFKKAHHARKMGVKIPKGATAKVITLSVDNFKTRSYSSATYWNVLVEFEGKMVYVPIEKLKKAGRPDVSMKEIKERCLSSARSCQFRSMWFGGWDDKNWALKLLSPKKVDLKEAA